MLLIKPADLCEYGDVCIQKVKINVAIHGKTYTYTFNVQNNIIYGTMFAT